MNYGIMARPKGARQSWFTGNSPFTSHPFAYAHQVKREFIIMYLWLHTS